MYVFFCVVPFIDISFNLQLFNNDFSDSEYTNWFLQTITLFLFIALLAHSGCAFATDRLVKSVFFAVDITAWFGVVDLVFFGMADNFISLIIRNGGVIVAILFAYFILYKP